MSRSIRNGALFVCASVPLIVAGCGGDPDPGAAAGETAAAAPPAAAPPAGAGESASTLPPLVNPRHPDANLMAPESFRVRFTTTRGEFVVEAHREWAPNGVDRFFNLVNIGFFDDARFFRVLEGFVAQFGINGDPEVMARWRGAAIRDDPVVQGNTRGRVVFAQTSSPNSRTTQMFVNTADNSRNLDPLGFAAIGEVVEGMDVVDALYPGYGEGAPNGRGPDQSRIQTRGNAYLSAEFPQLDHIETAVVID